MRVYPNTWMMIKPKTPKSMQMNLVDIPRKEIRESEKSNMMSLYKPRGFLAG